MPPGQAERAAGMGEAHVGSAPFCGVLSSAGLGGFAINLAAMTDLEHLYNSFDIIYFINHTVVALANAIPTLGASELLTARGARVS